jgi:putative transcriptional regulator
MMHTVEPKFDRSNRLVGRALIAMPHLEDTPFSKTVSLICSHDDSHAFGVVINKPMAGVVVGEVVAEMGIDADDATQTQPVFFGGPVDLQRGAVLHTLDFLRAETVPVTDKIGLTATKEALQVIARSARAPQKWMLIMGHAGWEGGQLENEIKRNDWLSTGATPQLVFGNPAETWSEAMSEIGVSDLGMFDANDSVVARPN